MKIFIYKSIIVFFLLIIAFHVTVNYKLRSYEKELKSFSSEENKEKYKNKIKDEMRKAIKKENYFTEEEKNLINDFLQKIKKELNDSAQ
tara:strand:+ start:242 stop:508 length:267 start_codon:yes stop_codon:yes gene_type:complete